jgi:hypothetical protein
MSFTHSNSSGNWIQVLINNGDGTFRDETATRLPQTDDPYAPPVNHDGNPDFGAHFGNQDEPYFYTDNARGVFHFAGTLGLPTGLWALAAVNGDGRLDVVLADEQNGAVSVALQAPPGNALPSCKPGQKPTKSHRCDR